MTEQINVGNRTTKKCQK